MICLGWLLVGAVTCGQDGGEDAPRKSPMQQRPIEIVLKENTASLMSLPGVVGTAQGECEGKPCIKVLVAAKTSALVQQIPSAIEGYEVEVVEIGEIKALDP